MNIVQAEENLKKISAKFSKESFIFDLMEAYNFPKSTISKLKIKLEKNPSEDVIVASKLHFTGVSKKELDSKFNELVKYYSTVKKAPRFIIVTDYQHLKAYDNKVSEKLDTEIKNLSKHPDFFLPWAGIEKKVFQGENPADVKAAEKLAKFFDLILKDNLKLVEKERHALNVFLTRILFCFFAEDTDIFEKDLFTDSIASHTKGDGSDLDDYLQRLFEILNTHKDKRSKKISEYLNKFDYVNGGLFADKFPIPKFSKKSRESLIDLGSDLNWAEINPDIFGSMIQAVVHPDQRAGLGMHYTSVTNIMKVIEPLFLTELKEEFAVLKNALEVSKKEFEETKGNLKYIRSNTKDNKERKKKFVELQSVVSQLKSFLDRIVNIKIFDPACGSGNFLIIAYKEMRLLEMDILEALGEIPVSGVTLSNFYGIEIDDFAHEVAKLSLWLTEHQMNVVFYRQFGVVKASLPLKETGYIVNGNSARIDWGEVCQNNRNDEIYVIGNPPYLGSSLQSKEQKDDLALICHGMDNYLNLDYIACWFIKASDYIRKNKNSKYAFVSTNSITQGEQVALMWPRILGEELKIGFAYKSFRWVNNAKSKAVVTCVIIGVNNKEAQKCYLFDSESVLSCKNISPYLIPSETIIVRRTSKAITKIPLMLRGSTPTDNGNLLLSDIEMKEMLKKDIRAKKFIKKFIGTSEFLRSDTSWCLWISDADIKEASEVLDIKKRLDAVASFRSKSKAPSTVMWAKFPNRFRQNQHKEADVIVIPRHVSEKREYVIAGFFSKGSVISDTVQAIYKGDLTIFAFLTSKIHMEWVKLVGGRIKTDVRYSSTLCYNTFPFPEISDSQRKLLEDIAKKILSIRAKYAGQNITEIYNPDLMPEELKVVHDELDKMVEGLIGIPNSSDYNNRMNFLLKKYRELVVKNG